MAGCANLPQDIFQVKLDMPKASICIASYNHARFLPETLSSVLGQNYHDFEVIVADDGSTDGSYQLLQDYAARHPQLKVVTHPQHVNRGISATVNLSLANATGEYISWLGSDDALYPDLLARGITELELNPTVGLVYGACHKVTEESSGARHSRTFGVDITRIAQPLEILINDCVISSCAVVFRRECFTQLGPLPTSLVCGDWDFYVKVAAHWGLAYLAEPLAMYRLHAGGTTNASLEINNRRLLDLANSLRNHALSIGGKLAAPRTRAVVELRRAYLCHVLGDMTEARASVAQAWNLSPELAQDQGFLTAWLTQHTGDKAFSEWFLRELAGHAPAAQCRQLRRIVLGNFALRAANEYRQAGHLRQARRAAFASLREDASWQQFRQAAPPILESLVGKRLWAAAQRFKHR